MLEFLRRNRVLLASGVFLILAASLVLRTGDGHFRADRLGSLILDLMGPLQRGAAVVSRAIGRTERTVHDVLHAREKIATLRTRLRALEAQSGQVAEVGLENERLRTLLDFRSTLRGDVVGARVIARDPSRRSQTLVVDRGETDGVVKGAAVLVPQGIVGHVFMTGTRVSRVLLVTDHNSGVDAMVQRTRARGIVEGTIDGGCGLKFVKRTEDLQVGDQVVTSGLDGIFPKGLPIGRIVTIDKKGQGLFQYAEIAPAVVINDLEEVLVTRGAIEGVEVSPRPEG